MKNNELFHKWIPYNGTIENPIILLHGFLETHTIWYHLPLQELKRPILLVDLPGFGKSNLEDDNHPTIGYFAQEVADLLAIYEISNYQVVGHSMGGYIGLELLKNNPLLNHVVLLNSNFWADSAIKQKERTRVADIILKNKNLFIQEAIPNLFIDKVKSKSTIDDLVEIAKNGIAEWYAYATIAMRERPDFTEFTRMHSDKISFIHGRQDGLVSMELVEEKTNSILQPIILEESGHMSLFEEPKNVINILNKILN